MQVTWKSTMAYQALMSVLVIAVVSCGTGCNRLISEPVRHLITYSFVAFESGTETSEEPKKTWDYELFDELRGAIKLTSLWQADDAAPAFPWPEDTDDAYRNCMGRFLDEPKLTTVFSFPADQIISPVSVDMSIDGKLLYVIDTANMVQVIDIESGATKKSFESPLEGAYAILSDVAGKYVFLANENTLAKVNLENKKLEASLFGILDGITDWERAVETNAIAGVNGSQIWYVNANFDMIELMPDATTESRHVAIHPQGKYVAGLADSKLFRWYVSEEPHRVENLPGAYFQNYDNPVTCDFDADRWYDFYGMHEYAGEEHSRARDVNGEHMPFVINPAVSDAISNFVGGNSWSTMVGTIADGTLTPPITISSMRWLPGRVAQHSRLIKIEANEVKKLWGNRLGNRVALYTDTDVRVCDRTMFDDPSGEMIPISLVKRVYFDKLGQIEIAANYLRARNWPENYLSGEEMYSRILEQVGYEWQWSELNPEEESAQKALAALEAWKDSDSEIAVAGSAFRYMILDGNQENREYAWQDLDKLLGKDRPPAVVFKLAIRNLMNGNGDIVEGFKLVKRCMQIYPEYLGAHQEMASWLLPGQRGVPGEVQIYADKIAQLYPQELQDQVYTILTLHILDSQQGRPLYGPEEANVDLDRIYRTARVMSQQDQLTRRQCQCLIRVADTQSDSDTAKEFAQYHLTHFVVPTTSGHFWNTPKILQHLKIDNWRATDRMRSEAAESTEEPLE